MRFQYKGLDGGHGLFSCYMGDLLICYINQDSRFIVWYSQGKLFPLLSRFNIRKMSLEKSMLVIITSMVLL